MNHFTLGYIFINMNHLASSNYTYFLQDVLQNILYRMTSKSTYLCINHILIPTRNQFTRFSHFYQQYQVIWYYQYYTIIVTRTQTFESYFCLCFFPDLLTEHCFMCICERDRPSLAIYTCYMNRNLTKMSSCLSPTFL